MGDIGKAEAASDERKKAYDILTFCRPMGGSFCVYEIFVNAKMDLSHFG